MTQDDDRDGETPVEAKAEPPPDVSMEVLDPWGRRAGRFRWTWPLALIVLMIGFYAVMWASRRNPAERDGRKHPSVGERWEQMELAPLVGGGQPLTMAELRGNVVLVNFWGTWCPPCRIEMPHIVELFERYRHNAGFRLVSVSCFASIGQGSAEQLRSETAAYLGELETGLTVHSDLSGFSRNQLMKASGLRNFAFPTTVVLDRDGTIRGLWIGYASGIEGQMRDALDQLLDQQ